jgi:hypothetical protein
MQINKFHLQPHSVTGPKSQKLLQSRGSDKDSANVNTPERAVAADVDAVKPYTDLLQDIPEVRPEVVEAARSRLANGEYTTSQAAVETAAALLYRS